MYAVYAIKSLLSNRIYLGQTNNIERRVREHNAKVVKSTKADCPWEIIAVQQFDKRNDARWKERQLKKSKGIRDKWLLNNACPPASVSSP